MESPPDHNKMIKEPLLSKQKGGFRTLPFIIANEAFEKVASFGLTPNMILYLTREYGMEPTRGANIIFLWTAATNFTPILGAFLADSFVGRYRMIGFGCIASLLGMVLLWSTALIPQARPPTCAQFSDSCESATTSQLLLLYSSLAFMSIGAGGIRSSSLAFGADQLNMRDNHQNEGILESFFSWYYVACSVAVVVAMTCIVYVQDNMGWKVGFGIPVGLMILSALSFFLASPFYVKPKAKTSLFTGLAQVLVASYKNRGIQLSPNAADEAYHHTKGSMLLMPSEELRFLNKACVVRNPQEDLTPDGTASDPWSLCTVDQVEDLKAVIKVIPIWSTGMIMSVTSSQGSIQTLQIVTMDRHVTSKFEIPAASFSAFPVLALAAWVALYDRIIIPLASKIKGRPARLSLKQKMGIGILLSSASMAVVAFVESVRRKIAIDEGFSDDPKAVVHMSAMWLLPHHILHGLAMSFNAIGQNEFYYTELPKSMASIATTLYEMGLSAASLVASFIMNSIDYITKKGGGESWVSSNINKGHYDYYFWVIAFVTLVNFTYYLACSKAYGPFKGEVGNVLDEGERMTDD